MWVVLSRTSVPQRLPCTVTHTTRRSPNPQSSRVYSSHLVAALFSLLAPICACVSCRVAWGLGGGGGGPGGPPPLSFPPLPLPAPYLRPSPLPSPIACFRSSVSGGRLTAALAAGAHVLSAGSSPLLPISHGAGVAPCSGPPLVKGVRVKKKKKKEARERVHVSWLRSVLLLGFLL